MGHARSTRPPSARRTCRFGDLDPALRPQARRPTPIARQRSRSARSARAGCGAAMVHFTRAPAALCRSWRRPAQIAGAPLISTSHRNAWRCATRTPRLWRRAVLDPYRRRRASLSRSCSSGRPPPGLSRSGRRDPRRLSPAHLSMSSHGPAGVQWCSQRCSRPSPSALLRPGAGIPRIYRRRSTSAPGRQGLSRRNGALLKDIGLLVGAADAAHCVHARPDELDMIAEAGATIVTNFSSNLHLRSGSGPIADAHRARLRDRRRRRWRSSTKMATPSAGCASSSSRMTGPASGATGAAREFLELAVRNGRRATGAPRVGRAGSRGAGGFRRCSTWTSSIAMRIMPVDPLDLFFARGNATCVRDGRGPAAASCATGSRPGSISRLFRRATHLFRKNLPALPHLQSAWPALERGDARWFEHAGGQLGLVIVADAHAWQISSVRPSAV